MSKVEVIPYDSSWPKIYEIEAKKIKEILGDQILSVHHIGSTSVEGLSAKKDIDILCVVKNLKKSLRLSKNSYTYKGELNIPLRFFYSKNTDFSKVNLHVTENDHGFISLNLTFRDYLRSNEGARKAYTELKAEILKDPKNQGKMPVGHLTKYGTKKDVFIKNILKEAGFNEYTINFCHHEAEWKAYQGLMGLVTEEDKVSSDFLYFILYKGIEIVAAAKTTRQGKILKIQAKKNEASSKAKLEMWVLKWRNLHN